MLLLIKFVGKKENEWLRVSQTFHEQWTDAKNRGYTAADVVLAAGILTFSSTKYQDTSNTNIKFSPRPILFGLKYVKIKYVVNEGQIYKTFFYCLYRVIQKNIIKTTLYIV